MNFCCCDINVAALPTTPAPPATLPSTARCCTDALGLVLEVDELSMFALLALAVLLADDIPSFAGGDFPSPALFIGKTHLYISMSH